MRRLIVLACLLAVAAPAAAQPGATLFAGSVPSAQATGEAMPLSLAQALQQGLAHNLGIINAEEQVESARGARLRSLRALMPRVDARLDESRQTRNLAAFGFNPALFPGIPAVVGPFNIFDARVYGSQALLDVSARHDLRSNGFALEAARLESENARDVVSYVVTSLYLQAVAGASRIETARSQVETAEALLTLATNQRNAGVTPGIDVVRAQVQRQAQRQRLIAAENEFEKQVLQLVRAIGLPAAQRVSLVDRELVVSQPILSLDAAVKQAAEGRADYRAAIERVHAAEAAVRAAATEALPSVHVSADIGTIGSAPSNARRTYSISGAVRVSLFDEGRRGREAENAARLRQRQAEAADFLQRIEADVRVAFLDVQASEQQLAVARERVALAKQELSLAEIRFRAGVTSNLEVIQAQNAVTAATDTEVAAVYAFNLAKASLARAVGQ